LYYHLIYLLDFEKGVKLLSEKLALKPTKPDDEILEEDVVSPSLYNNIGTLRLEIKKLKEAGDAFDEAKRILTILMKNNPGSARLNAWNITL
jgi:hypothetical protein